MSARDPAPGSIAGERASLEVRYAQMLKPPASSEGTRLADAAIGTIMGGIDADKVIAELRSGTAHPDRLLEELHAVLGTRDDHRMYGFLRGISKALERGHA